MNEVFILLGIESWKPILSALALPPVPLLLVVLLGARLILPRRGLGWTLVVASVLLIYLSCCNGTARLLARYLLRPPPALTAEGVAELKSQVKERKPVAIVVLGGGMVPLAPEYGVSSLNELSLERLRYGIWLSRETGAPVAFSGGVGWGQQGGSVPEAQTAQRIATQEFGRPLKWIEDRSRDTRENAAYSAVLLKEQGITQIVLVTHQLHMPRAVRAFERATRGEVRVQPAPINPLGANSGDGTPWLPSASGFRSVNHVLHEWFGWLAGA